MSATPGSVDPNTYRLVARRLVPLIFIGQCLLHIDRTNLSFAALQMNADLGIGAEVFGFAAGIFFVGYALFEVPSNLILQRVGASKVLGTAIVVWGVVTVLMAFVPDAATFIVLRFLLGVAEGAYLPGVLLFLRYWLPAGQRGRPVALVVAAGPIAAVVGGPLAGAILQIGWLGLSGWQWLFIIEGVAPIIFGICWFRMLPSEPAKARWLDDGGKRSIAEALAADRALTEDNPHTTASFLDALRRRAVWIYSLAYFGLSVGYYGVLLWLPQIVQSQFAGLSPLQNGLLSAVPFVCAIGALAVSSRTSDRSGDRRGHLAAFGAIGGFALVVSTLVASPILSFAAVCVAMMCAICFISVFWASPMTLLAGSAAAGGIAMINSLGNLGGFLGPYMAGAFRAATGSFTTATISLAVFLMIAGAVPLIASNLFPNLRRRAGAVAEPDEARAAGKELA